MNVFIRAIITVEGLKGLEKRERKIKSARLNYYYSKQNVLNWYSIISKSIFFITLLIFFHRSLKKKYSSK